MSGSVISYYHISPAVGWGDVAPCRAPLVNHTYGMVYSQFGGDESDLAGVRRHDAWPNGSELTALDYNSIPIHGTFQVDAPWTLTYNRQLIAVCAGQGSNSSGFSFLNQRTLSFVSSFGIISGSTAPSGGDRMLTPDTCAAIQGAGSDFIITTPELTTGEVVCIDIDAGLCSVIGTMTEGRGVIGALPDGSGTYAFVLGRDPSDETLPLTLYRANTSALVPIGVIHPSAFGSGWTSTDIVYGLAIDQTDGNPIVAVANSLDGKSPILAKLSAADASVLWVTNLLPAGHSNFSPGDLQQALITQQKLYYIGTDNHIVTVDTATGASTATASAFGGGVSGSWPQQVSEDVVGSVYYNGNFTPPSPDTITAANASGFVRTIYTDYADLIDYTNSLGASITDSLSDIPPGTTSALTAIGAVGQTFAPPFDTNFPSSFYSQYAFGAPTDATYLSNTCGASGPVLSDGLTDGVIAQITALATSLSMTFAQVCALLDGGNRAPGDTTPGYCIATAATNFEGTATCGTRSVLQAMALIYLFAPGTPPAYYGTWMAGGGHTTVAKNTPIRYFPNTSIPAPGTPPELNTSRQRAWTFTLDGHKFYVLDLGTQGTVLYDSTTKSWCKFGTKGYPNWNFRNGTMWDQRMVGGDTDTPQIYEMSPSSMLDGGSLPITHIVSGALSTRTRTFMSVAGVRLNTSVGTLDSTTGATVLLEFSDDQGKTWVAMNTIALTQSDYDEELAWRALGSFAAPGRVFRITDVGGFIRIDGCDAEIDNFDEDGNAATQDT